MGETRTFISQKRKLGKIIGPSKEKLRFREAMKEKKKKKKQTLIAFRETIAFGIMSFSLKVTTARRQSHGQVWVLFSIVRL